MEITVKLAGIPIQLFFLDVVVFAIAIMVALAGLVTGLLARKIWLMVEGELAASWRWVLPGFGIYVAASGLRVLSVFLGSHDVYPLVSRYISFVKTEELSRIFLVLQSASELVFLIFIVFGLVRQYRLFASLSLRE
ncbi:MAG: hypothetical protein M1548_10385 [Actinobacteria bacterium]|nr:hypothetical protein [Actinomycetota bacterium]